MRPSRTQTTVLLTAATLCLTGTAPHSAPAPTHAIVDAASGYLLGASSGDKWVQSPAAAKAMAGGEKYRVCGLHGLIGEANGTKPASQGPPCDDTLFVTFAKGGKTMEFHAGTVAVAGTWNAQPRVPRAQNVDQPVYRRVVADLLKAHGIRRPHVKIEQLLRVDLDGDGEPEVLITATDVAGPPGGISPDARAGSYSFVLLRHMVHGKLRTQLLDGEFHPHFSKFTAPNRYAVAGLLDLNGDGRMEIVLHSQYYEGDGTTVYTERNGEYKPVRDSGCGA